MQTYKEEYLKSLIKDFFKLIHIRPNEDGRHTVKYVSFSFGNNRVPMFVISHCTLNLTQFFRDINISQILESKTEKSKLQLDESFLTEKQIERLNKLRDNTPSVSEYNILRACEVEWANQFNVGDRVNFNGAYGIISYKHQMKSTDFPQEWTVKSNGVEYRYVSGAFLTPNKKEDLSKIEIDKELDKLSTIKLLKMYKKSLERGRGVGNKKIKRILNDREDLTNNKITKIVNYR